MQQHQCQQAADLRIGAEPRQQPAQADGFRGQVQAQRAVAAAGRVAFVEDEVEHAQHAAQALGELVRLRHFVGNARVAYLGLGAHDALRHGRRRYQKGMRDFFRRQAAHLAQGQGDAGFFRQAGVAAGEDEPQAIVFDLLALVPVRRRVGHRLDGLGMILPADQARIAAQAVDRLEPADGDQPGDRVRRHAVAGPLLGRRQKGIVFRFLGQVQASQQPHQRREDAPPVAAVDGLQRGQAAVTGLGAGWRCVRHWQGLCCAGQLAWVLAQANASSCKARASCVRDSPKSSISKKGRISISESLGMGLGQRRTHSMASSMLLTFHIQ